ncbi:unnamed protein product [Ceutorhynchus assimilis]|uniref:Inosine/uridine-preferring nucleoside hydrolase domain-containing protein n=1 Tax=Ceutorhynchus assimilis TaxID=467358 RepID=A0A9N9QGF0_9CUCU|nr:unnamed protein product [Ceutorhynchus assimilis]
MDQRRAIVNVDVGVDDYYALLILLYAEKRGELKIEALVCSSGNTNVTNVLKNTVRLLELVDRTDIPVYKGVGEAFIRHTTADDYFGKDGFGDLEYDKEPNLDVVKSDLAAIGLNELITANPGEISLICLAPLTDIAVTLKLFSDFSSSVRDIWILGGNYRATHPSGVNTEFNFLYDPVAAHIVFENVLLPRIYIYTYEGFSQSTITYEWKYNVLGSQTPTMALATRAEKSIGRDQLNSTWDHADAILAFCFVKPESCVLESQLRSVDIELKNQEKLGWIIWDPDNKSKNVQLIETVDQEAIKSYLLEVTNYL